MANLQRPPKVVIVGGVAGGATAAARLRRLNEHARIILLERGDYISFANCGLPYYIGGAIPERGALTLQTPDSFQARFNIEVRVRHQVTATHPAQKSVTVQALDTGETYEETYDQLILSPGAAPIRPPIEGIDSDKVFTLRNIPDAEAIKRFIQQHRPRQAAVVGGGYIGIEMAENLHQAGLEVTLIEAADQVLAPIDYDMACEVHRHIQSKGVRLLLGNGVRSIADTGHRLTITLEHGQVEADMLILAVGVRPETRLARQAGIAVNEAGSIIVDPHMRTSQPDIYAVGDAVEVTDLVTGQKAFIPLAGPANKQGRIAADNICGIPSVYTGTQGSAIVKVFDMTVACTGLNEKTAKRLGLAYDKTFTFSPSHASYYPGSTYMTIKTLFEPETGKILGAQIVGFDGVDKRCDVLATAIRAGMTARDLTALELCYAPPYGSAKDPVNMVGYVIENLLSGQVRQFHWHEVEKLPRDGSVTLLDTRTPGEYRRGHIDGFINIPLDSLRSRLGELDKSKPVYVTCQVGLRGYIAARILAQHGFEVYNLSGGYRLYHTIFGNATPSQGESPALNPETQLPVTSKT